MDQPVLEMRGISKSFPGVRALDHVDFDLRPGEVHAVLGENGAGKSTLMKILAGDYQKDSGRIVVAGQEVEITSPRKAAELGIRLIYQELNVIPPLTVAENILLGRFPGAGAGFVSWRGLYREARAVLDRIGIDLDPRAVVSTLSVAQKQMVEIAKAIAVQPRILVMDEPTAALSEQETRRLFAIVRTLRAAGVGIIYISHRIEELFALADRVTVLRDGHRIGTVRPAQTTRHELVRMMVGRELGDMYPKRPLPIGEVLLEVRGLSTPEQLRDIDLTLRRGEILGIFGLMGAGQTELAKALVGAVPWTAGEAWLRGRKVAIRSPQEARLLGIGLAPIDRKAEGLVLVASVKNNITLASVPRYTRGEFVDEWAQRRQAERWVGELDIRTPSVEQLARNLSGGNQQKVVLARLLESDAEVLVLDDPTRGVDVGAKVEIYQLLERLCEQGKAVIMISSELQEVLAIADRILVLTRGRVGGEFHHGEATQEAVMHAAVGQEGTD